MKDYNPLQTLGSGRKLLDNKRVMYFEEGRRRIATLSCCDLKEEVSFKDFNAQLVIITCGA